MNVRLLVASVATIAVVSLAGCGATNTPTATPAAVTSAATPTTTATPVVSVTEKQDRTYFACAAPVYGLHVSYDAAKAAAPDELNTVISSGRTLYSTYTDLPLSVDDAIKAADLTDDEAATLRCAVQAFGDAA